MRSGLTRRNEIAVRETTGGLQVRVEPPRGIVLTRSLEIRIARLEQAAKAHAKYDPACICFPANQFPKVAWPVELEIAAKVKCPLHGDRFVVPGSFRFNYLSKWLREKTWGVWVPRCSEPSQKAYYASFPSDLWPTEEEETEHGLYLRLKDGTRLLATGSLAETPRRALQWHQLWPRERRKCPRRHRNLLQSSRHRASAPDWQWHLRWHSLRTLLP
jgi:hypothetical protein